MRKVRFLSLLVMAIFVGNAVLAGLLVAQSSPENASAKASQTDAESTEPAEPVFDPSRVSIIPEVTRRSWELNPYQVLVWICHDGSPRLNSVYPKLKEQILRRAELADPSGWAMHIQQPPAQWRNRLRYSLPEAQRFEEIADQPELVNADKLIVVAINDTTGIIDFKVREYDVQTQQWGAIVNRETGQLAELDRPIFNAIKKAFMPIARVDRIGETGSVFMRARAVNACIRAVQNAEGAWILEAITSSPVWIRSDDRFLPVIRRVDRKGQLAKLEPIDSTFLTIDKQEEGYKLTCSIQSSRRAPLAQRASKRAQKLALVIRPPENPTDLKLVSQDDENLALAGYEVWSRRPGQVKEEESEYLGVTDWRGIASIPPSKDGLRLIYIKRGSRFLKKIPIIPGLYGFIQTDVPDDETRLYAEGIVQGLQTEILNLVAQRQVYETQIESAINANSFDEASDLLEKYQMLQSPQELKNSLGDEESRLKSLTGDRRELEQISKMFGQLRDALNSKVGDSKEPQLREALQKARRVETTQ